MEQIMPLLFIILKRPQDRRQESSREKAQKAQKTDPELPAD
jgi:hypothetical protein